MSRESEFTAANGWCAHPERWHADDDQATEREVTGLVAAFVRALQPETVVETGTYKAGTATAIARALHSNGRGHLFSFELDGALAVSAYAKLRGLPATVVRGSSLDELPGVLTGRTVGFAWLDSAPDMRAKELLALVPYLEPGAVVGIHDTRPGRPPAVSLDRLLATGKLFDALTLRTPRGVTFAQLRRS
jgi:predicted O-methyltransferase YrrM